MESVSMQMIALFLLTIIVVLFISKTKMVFDTDKVFFGLLVGVFASALADIVATHINEVAEILELPKDYVNNVTQVYLWTLLFVVYLVSMYTVKIVERKIDFVNRWLFLVMATPALIVIVIGILSNPEIVPVGTGFYTGWYVNVVVGCLLLYCFVCIFFIIKYQKGVVIDYYNSGIVFYILLAVTVILQIMLKENAVMSIGIAIATLYMYMEMENPDDYLDHASGALNDFAFVEWGRINLKHPDNTKVMVISLPDVSYMKDHLGEVNYSRYIKTIFLSLKELRVGKVFRLDSGDFIVVAKATEAEEKIHRKLVALFRVVHLEYASMSSELLRYGIVENFDAYENIKAFTNDLWYFLQYLAEQEADELYILNENVIHQRTNEDFIVSSLQDAIANNQVMVYYQPIYSVKERQFTTAEALIRVKDVDGNFMNPEVFIPIAERRGLILTLSDMVFHNVCRFVQEQKLMEKGFGYIEVNLSTVQCMQDNLSAQLVSIMNKYEIEPGFINLEITETAAIQSDKILLHNMERMRELGVSFSLDDYGSGYSNLDYVINMPFHLVKLDKRLVWDGVSKKKSKILLETSIRMFSKMKLQIVAEGVETAEQAQYLENLGVDFLQGYYFSKPICEDEFIEMMRQNGML